MLKTLFVLGVVETSSVLEVVETLLVLEVVEKLFVLEVVETSSVLEMFKTSSVWRNRSIKTRQGLHGSHFQNGTKLRFSYGKLQVKALHIYE